jgi:hypothetical protein
MTPVINIQAGRVMTSRSHLSEAKKSGKVSLHECKSGGRRYAGSLSRFIVPFESREMLTRQSLRLGKGLTRHMDSFMGNTPST